jgi:hypothetical protein
MSITNDTNSTADTTNCKYIISDTSESDARCSYSTRENGRAIFREPGGEVLNVARLTAYAEHGEEIYDVDGQSVVHHEIPLYTIDIPEFLCPMSRAEHSGFHASEPEPIYVDGIPLLRPEEVREEVDG